MKLISCNNVATNRYQLEIAVEAADFNNAIVKVYNQEKSKISIPGFRKGKAPLAFIEKIYGKEVFFNDAIQESYPAALDAAITEAKLDVIEDKVDFELGEEVSKEVGYTFKATVTTYPVVSIKDYMGVNVTPKSNEVTEEDIQKTISELLDRYSRQESVERPAQNDDVVVMDFEGFIDGEAFEGGKAENYSVTLGTKMFIPGFEDQVIGHVPGDDFDVNVSFPEEYQAAELAGKPATFKVHIHEIKGKILPTFDDEFVKDISEFNTVDEMREDMRKNLQAAKDRDVSDDIENQIMMAVNEKLEGEIPEAMYEKQIDTEIRAFNYRLQNQGLRFETYMQLTGQNPQTLRESFRQQAENQVKIRLALEKIAELEGITASEEEIEAEFQNLAAMYKLDVEKVKEMIPAEGQKKDVIARKTMNLIRENVVVVPAAEAAEEAEKPAKKTTRKKTTKKAEAAEGEEAEKPVKKTRKTTKKTEEEPKEEPAADAE